MAFPADYTLDPNRELLASQIGAIRYIGILEIPSLSLPIADDWQNDNFDLTPCRYTGSPYTDDLVVLGHNYASQLRALTGIAPGAAVTFTDLDGSVFSYTVSDTEILPPDAVEEMVTGDWALTIFTCTIGGQNRLAVRCVHADA